MERKEKQLWHRFDGLSSLKFYFNLMRYKKVIDRGAAKWSSGGAEQRGAEKSVGQRRPEVGSSSSSSNGEVVMELHQRHQLDGSSPLKFFPFWPIKKVIEWSGSWAALISVFQSDEIEKSYRPWSVEVEQRWSGAAGSGEKRGAAVEQQWRSSDGAASTSSIRRFVSTKIFPFWPIKKSYRVERQLSARFPLISVDCHMRCLNRLASFFFLKFLFRSNIINFVSLDCSNLGLVQWPNFGEMREEARYWIKSVNMNSKTYFTSVLNWVMLKTDFRKLSPKHQHFSNSDLVPEYWDSYAFEESSSPPQLRWGWQFRSGT